MHVCTVPGLVGHRSGRGLMLLQMLLDPAGTAQCLLGYLDVQPARCGRGVQRQL